MNKEIKLTEDEIKQMLRGTLLWSDIAPRLNPGLGSRSGIRKLGTPLSSRNTLPVTPIPADDNQESEKKEPEIQVKLYPERDELFQEKQTVQEMHSDIKEVQALLSERGEYHQGSLEGMKVVALLSFAGIAVASLWLYYFLIA